MRKKVFSHRLIEERTVPGNALSPNAVKNATYIDVSQESSDDEEFPTNEDDNMYTLKMNMQ